SVAVAVSVSVAVAVSVSVSTWARALPAMRASRNAMRIRMGVERVRVAACLTMPSRSACRPRAADQCAVDRGDQLVDGDLSIAVPIERRTSADAEVPQRNVHPLN